MSCLLRISDHPGEVRRGLALLIALLSIHLAAGQVIGQVAEPEEPGRAERGSASAPGKTVKGEAAPGKGDAEKEEEKKPLTPEQIRAKEKAAAELEKVRQQALAEILGGATELSPAQKANFEKWLPHTFKRLQRRLPVHIVAIGDSVTRYMSYDDKRENSHYAYHGVFAAKLANEFFYTGGVRDILPTKGHEPKLEKTLGPELTLENLGMNGRNSLHALSRITTDAMVNQPDLVIINFGINDALTKIKLATYVKAIDRSVRYVKSTGADVMLLGPSHTMREANLRELAMTRPYSGAMRELAERLGVFYFDLADVTMRAPGTPGAESPQQALTSILESYREQCFDHGPENVDGLHPCGKAHQLMGAAIFDALRDGREPEPYRLGGFLSLVGEGEAVLEFKLKNLEQAPAKGRLLLMPVAGMQPEQESVSFELAAGKGQIFKVVYRPRGGTAFDFPADSPRVFAPMIITDTARSYSPVFAAAVLPLGVVWNSGLIDGAKGNFEVKCALVATGTTAVDGSYQASWRGQSSVGKFTLQPNGRETLSLGFDLPGAADPPAVRGDLVLTLELGGQKLRFVRGMEASRNIGLGEDVELLNPSKYQKGEEAHDGRVKFNAQADAKKLVLNFDTEGFGLDGDDQNPAAVLEFQLDARGYGKRRKFGFVDFARVKFDNSGKAERLSELRPAVFGEWYDRALDNNELAASSTVLSDGRRRFSVSIPRSYLYRHEYALGNGNSLFGINAVLSFAKASQPEDPYPADRRFVLVDSGLSRHSAESLTVLELAPKSTGRWSVRIE